MSYKIYRSSDDGIQVILQQNKGGEWYTVHGGDYYVLINGQWLPYDHIGFVRWLEAKDLGTFAVSDEHAVYYESQWRTVDRYGIAKFAEQHPDILLGSMVTDEEWDKIMAQVLEDMLYAKENGKLPE